LFYDSAEAAAARMSRPMPTHTHMPSEMSPSLFSFKSVTQSVWPLTTSSFLLSFFFLPLQETININDKYFSPHIFFSLPAH
jgi:hypothetical protein